MTTTGNDLAVRNGSSAPAYQQAALAIKPGQLTWDKYQEAALAQIGLKNAGNADRAVFLHQCQRTGLDPFARQIYMIERREKVQGTNEWTSKWTIQTGIDGYRVNRARAERAAGVRGTLSRALFYDWDGVEHKAWVRAEPPAACEITYTVRDPDGTETPYTSVLRFDEYVQTRKETRDGTEQRVPSGQWATKPAHMLEKCTEADVYRKAFPQDFSGIHLDDAMPPAEDAPAGARERPRVTAQEIRDRAARRADPVTGEVIPGSPPEADDPRAGVLARFDALKVAGPEIPAYLTRLSGHPYASVDSLSSAAAGWFTAKLAGLGSRDELEAAAVAAEARREQDTAAEATGEAPDGQ